MRTGNFSAIGWEATIRPITFVVLLAGALQIFLVLFIGGLYYSLFVPSLLLMAVSLGGFAMLNVRAQRSVGMYDVSYVDRRGESGSLELSYAMKDRIGREHLKVKSINPDRHPLDRPSWSRGPTFVKGTVASLTIHFASGQKARRLELGFPSVDEMNGVYEQLK